MADLKIIKSEVMAYFIERMEKEGKWSEIIDDLINRRTDPYLITVSSHIAVLCTEFGMEEKKFFRDGVVPGYGK